MVTKIGYETTKNIGTKWRGYEFSPEPHLTFAQRVNFIITDGNVNTCGQMM